MSSKKVVNKIIYHQYLKRRESKSPLISPKDPFQNKNKFKQIQLNLLSTLPLVYLRTEITNHQSISKDNYSPKAKKQIKMIMRLAPKEAKPRRCRPSQSNFRVKMRLKIIL